MYTINITAHPSFAEITRKVKLRELHYDEDKAFCKVELRVKHFLNTVAFPEMERAIVLTLDNSNTFPDGAGTIGDYTYFTTQCENNVGFKTIVQNIVGYLDTDGRINAACNYK